MVLRTHRVAGNTATAVWPGDSRVNIVETGDFTVDNSQPTSQGLTRRELLKRGAALGGALAWATPAVQLIGMTPALASHVSGLCVCAKFEGCNDDGQWVDLGNENPGNCLRSSDHGDCDRQFDPDESFTVVDNAGECGPDQFCIQFNGSTVTIYFPEYCRLIAVAEKVGGGADPENCNFILSDANQLSPFMFEIESDCSHLEFCFDCT
jgi:hypothetical protein